MAGMCQSEVVLLPKLLLGGLCVCFTRSHVELGSCLNVSEQLLTYTWLTQRRERTNDCALTGATRWVQQELNRQHLYKKVTFEWTSDSELQRDTTHCDCDLSWIWTDKLGDIIIIWQVISSFIFIQNRFCRCFLLYFQRNEVPGTCLRFGQIWIHSCNSTVSIILNQSADPSHN